MCIGSKLLSHIPNLASLVNGALKLLSSVYEYRFILSKTNIILANINYLTDICILFEVFGDFNAKIFMKVCFK